MTSLPAFDPGALTPGIRARWRLPVAALPDGSQLDLTVLTVTGSRPGPRLALLAGVHGDEYEGVRAIPEVLAGLDPTELCGSVVAVPLCNVPAYLAATRSSPVDGLNLARVFPGDPAGTVTERIAHLLTEQVIGPASFLLDLHSAGIAYTMPTLVGYPEEDTPLGRTARGAAFAFGAPAVWAHPPDPTATGRTVSAAAERGIPWLYAEAAGGGRVREEDLACYVNGVRGVMQFLGMLSGLPEAAPPRYRLRGSGNLDASLRASGGGYFVARAALLEWVAAGQVVGEIRDPAGEPLEVLRAPSAGRVVLLRGLPRVLPGEWVFALTGDAPD